MMVELLCRIMKISREKNLTRKLKNRIPHQKNIAHSKLKKQTTTTMATLIGAFKDCIVCFIANNISWYVLEISFCALYPFVAPPVVACC